MPYAALCSVPTAPTNGGVTSTGISIGDTATYTCDVGFELVGTATATCTAAADGGSSFIPLAPMCYGKKKINVCRGRFRGGWQGSHAPFLLRNHYDTMMYIVLAPSLA